MKRITFYILSDVENKILSCIDNYKGRFITVDYNFDFTKICAIGDLHTLVNFALHLGLNKVQAVCESIYEYETTKS